MWNWVTCEKKSVHVINIVGVQSSREHKRVRESIPNSSKQSASHRTVVTEYISIVWVSYGWAFPLIRSNHIPFPSTFSYHCQSFDYHLSINVRLKVHHEFTFSSKFVLQLEIDFLCCTVNELVKLSLLDKKFPDTILNLYQVKNLMIRQSQMLHSRSLAKYSYESVLSQAIWPQQQAVYGSPCHMPNQMCQHHRDC